MIQFIPDQPKASIGDSELAKKFQMYFPYIMLGLMVYRLYSNAKFTVALNQIAKLVKETKTEVQKL